MEVVKLSQSKTTAPKLTPTQFLILIYGVTIILGTALLMLPTATVNEPLKLVDALFMAPQVLFV